MDDQDQQTAGDDQANTWDQPAAPAEPAEGADAGMDMGGGAAEEGEEGGDTGQPV